MNVNQVKDAEESKRKSYQHVFDLIHLRFLLLCFDVQQVYKIGKFV